MNAKILRMMLVMLPIAIIVSFVWIGISTAADDNSRYRSNTSSMFSPGYINAAKYQAEAIKAQQSAKKSLLDNVVAYIQGKVHNTITAAGEQKDRTTVTLQKKQGSAKNTRIAANRVSIGADIGNIKIGSGTNQEKNSAGHLIAEIINGIRYVYAGFEGGLTIAQAMDKAGSGNRIIVRAGTYTENITVRGGISLYGGYGETGERDFAGTPTVINGSFTAAGVNGSTYVSGFMINSGSANGFMAEHSSGITVLNCTFNGDEGASGIWAEYSSITAMNNNFHTTYGINVVGETAVGVQPSDLTTYVTSSINNNFYYESIRLFDTSGNVIVTSSSDYATDQPSGESGPLRWFKAGVGIYVADVSTKTIDYYDGGQMLLAPTDVARGAYASMDDSVWAPNAKALNTYSPIVGLSPVTSPLFYNNLGERKFDYSNMLTSNNTDGRFDAANSGSILKDMLNGKTSLARDLAGMATPQLVMAGDRLKESAFAVPVKGMSAADMQIAMRFAVILKNPTEDQKMVLDAVRALLNNTAKIQEGGNINPELTKIEDDFLNAVANILLAQALPDLLQKGDTANIKAIFSELDFANRKILLEYEKASQPYYENVIKDLSKNMAALQLKNILSGNISKDELEKLSPSELDKILEKIKRQKDRAFGEDYILQQEAKYRKVYLEPSRKKLEADMKNMLQNYTAKINDMLK